MKKRLRGGERRTAKEDSLVSYIKGGIYCNIGRPAFKRGGGGVPHRVVLGVGGKNLETGREREGKSTKKRRGGGIPG